MRVMVTRFSKGARSITRLSFGMEQISLPIFTLKIIL